VAEAVGEFHRLVVGDIIGVGFAFVAEVVAVGAAWVYWSSRSLSLSLLMCCLLALAC
jgi:hypothetical protein